MSNTAINRAFSQRLEGVATQLGLRVASANISFTPSTNEVYLMEALLPAITTTPFLAAESLVYVGVYQVLVVGVADMGADHATQIAEAIAAAFPVNDQLATDTTLRIFVDQPPTVGAGIAEQTSYNVPVSVNYRADS
ncbi:hypothetical protein SUSUWATARI_00450 [Serratia phage vB_SmaM-Susuwatari]|nr:hypothetical protein SUSUWATARI_00450 [Serratia phage vB_SmaM-Susuwatari]